MKVRADSLCSCIVRVSVVIFVASAASTTLAAGVVGTGTAASCTDAALNAALAGGGLVTFNCGSDPVTIDISTGTGTKTIAADTTIDGGGLITISGGNHVRVFVNGVNLTVENLTIANGRVPVNVNGGGIVNDGTLSVTNSTFISNSGDSGGAIASAGPLTITNSTFFGNSGGAIYTYGGLAAMLRNTIVANGNCIGSITDGGHNLDDGTSCGFSAANGSLSNTDPRLDPAGLQNHGGPTQTVALLPDSPAINAGDQAICAAAPVSNRDQRGFGRPGAGHTNCSIGAYEADAMPAEVCVGDCTTMDRVTVDERVKGVNIALGTATLDQCQRFDCNHDGHVTVDCLVQAVNHALNGCG